MNRYLFSKAGIDVNEGVARCGGDEALYEHLLDRFSEESRFEEMREALASQDVQGAFAAAHALKGLSGNLSMNRLYRDIMPLVEELRAGSLSGTADLFARVEVDYREVIQVLEQRVR